MSVLHRTARNPGARLWRAAILSTPVSCSRLEKTVKLQNSKSVVAGEEHKKLRPVTTAKRGATSLKGEAFYQNFSSHATNCSDQRGARRVNFGRLQARLVAVVTRVVRPGLDNHKAILAIYCLPSRHSSPICFSLCHQIDLPSQRLGKMARVET
jgi:hypothetical protein